MKTFFIILLSVIISTGLSWILFKNHPVNDSDFINFKDIGQIAFDEDDKIKIQAFRGNDILIESSDLIINAGNEFIELRVGDNAKLRIERDSVYINSNNLFINGKKY